MNYLTLFLQEGPAETTDFMILGFVVIFGTMAIHLASLYLRNRNLHRDIELLDDLSAGKSNQEPSKLIENGEELPRRFWFYFVNRG